MNKTLLFIPGPVTVAEPVLAAMAQPMIDHRGAAFAETLESITTRMKPIFGTSGDVLVLGASGSGGLEAAAVNCFAPGSTILACPIGVFGRRFIAICKSFGIEVEVLETPFGEGLDPERLAARLREPDAKRFAGIYLTHNETSTGVQNIMAPLADAIRANSDALVVVDSVSGLGASRFGMDEWGFDVVVTASQKALAAPPGLAMVAVSERAWSAIATPKPRFYFDLMKAREFARLGQTPWTPPVSILFAMDCALDLYENEGPERVWARHDRYARAIRRAAEALGLGIFSHAPYHSNTVVAMTIPPGIEAAALLRTMRESRGVSLSGGQGELKGKIVRMGTMGDISQTDVLGALGALEMALLQHGLEGVQVGAGVRAALEIFLAETPAETAQIVAT